MQNKNGCIWFVFMKRFSLIRLKSINFYFIKSNQLLSPNFTIVSKYSTVFIQFNISIYRIENDSLSAFCMCICVYVCVVHRIYVCIYELSKRILLLSLYMKCLCCWFFFFSPNIFFFFFVYEIWHLSYHWTIFRFGWAFKHTLTLNRGVYVVETIHKTIQIIYTVKRNSFM